VSVSPTRLCIVSRHPLRSGDFIAALQESLSPDDHIDIIMDRRRGESSWAPDSKEDRRQRHVDRALEADGFAIVPTSADSTADSTEDRSPLTLPLPEAPIEHLSLEDDEDQESIESSPGVQQSGRRIPALLGVAIGVTVAALLLTLAGADTGQRLMYQLLTGPLSGGPGQPAEQTPGQPAGQTNESSTSEQLREVTEKPAVAKTRLARTETPPPARSNGESPPADGPARTKPVSPLDADKGTSTQREPSGPDTASRELGASAGRTGATPKEPSRRPRVASIPASESGAPAKGGTDEVAGGRGPRLSATARPSPGTPASSDQVASALSPEAAAPKATPTPSVGAHRAELVRKPVSRGWGNSYAVRLSDAEGQPMVVASVWLVAHMADGTVESVAMGALPEPGTYRGTVPTSRSTPVDLLVRLSTGDKFVEVPVKP
jgi:hypothetical protein